MLRALRLWLVCAVLSLGAGAARAQPPIWVVHGRHATVVLFGSVHLLPPGLNWRPPPLDQAIAQANDLWFEIPLDDAANLKAGQLALARGLQPAGETLSGELSPDARTKLAKAAQASGLPVAGLDRLRPWLAEITLAVAAYRHAGATEEDGVERQLSAIAAPPLERRALETVQDQILALSGGSLADQVASLDQTLDELDDDPASYKRLVDDWIAGDVAGLRREALDPLIKSAPGAYRSLVVDRNRRWVDIILTRLNAPGEAVMVVGVGHLIGPDSVPALLRARGVRVDGP
jgi:uncharacterized protein YbaP (TraB family)